MSEEKDKNALNLTLTTPAGTSTNALASAADAQAGATDAATLDLLSPTDAVVQSGSRARSRSRSPIPYTAPSQEEMRELMQGMRGSLEQLTKTFDVLHEQSARVANMGPPIDSATQLQALRREMRRQEKRQDKRIGEVKHLVKDVLKDQIAEHMRSQIAEQIKEEIALQVRAQVASQLAVRLPVSLAEQTEASARQLAEVRCSLANSEARRANAVLRPTAVDEPLARVLRHADSTASDMFPRDLKALFAFDAVAARKLVEDYNLPVSEVREQNLNRFMSHIGIPFQVIPVPMTPDASGSALTVA